MKTSMSSASTTSRPIAAMIPRGIDRAGSLASSAASGTLSTARKNQMANGKAAQMPSRPNGRKDEAPTASVAGMSSRRPASNCGTAPARKTTSPSTATTATASMTLSASPTPSRWMPMNSAYTAR